MHCENGVWHANATVFGAWGPGLGYTFDYLTAAPPPFRAQRRMIERGHPWFSLIDLDLPATERRPAMALHLASITGTVWAPDVEAELFACADLIVFYAETASYQLERTRAARETLGAWMATRDPALVVAQLDRPYIGGTTELDGVEEPVVALELETLRTELALSGMPVVETSARDGQLGTLLRTVVEQLLAARDALPARARYGNSTPR